MKVCVVNGSPKGKNSTTLYTSLYLAQKDKKMELIHLPVGQKIRYYENHWEEVEEALGQADLVLFSYPVYTFIAPWQLHRFIELLKESDMDLSGKYATQISTSKHFYDVTAHKYIEQNIYDLGMNYIKGLSADMDDLTTNKGQKEAIAFWKFVRYSVKHHISEAPVIIKTKRSSYKPTLEEVTKQQAKRVVIVTNAEEKDKNLWNMIEDFRKALPYESEIANIREYPFAGGCISCFRCATKGECIYKDGFSDYLKNTIQSKDAMVFAFTIKDHSMGASFKLYDDRQFCNGHRTVTMGMPVGYLVCGNYKEESNLQMIVEGRADVGHNYLAGVAQDAEGIKKMIAKLCYAMEHQYVPPQNFFGVGGMKIFRDLIYVMGGMMKADYSFYKEKGFFKDMPNKQYKRIVLMKLVGAMMSNEKLMKKAGSKMTEGMVAPYEKVLKKNS